MEERLRRGSILDRNGKPLAMDGKVDVVGVVPADLQDEEATIQQLSELIAMPVDEIKAAYADAEPGWFMPIKQYPGEVDPKTLSAIGKMPGVQVREETARIYPLGKRAAHITGYVTKVTQEDLEADTTGKLIGLDWIGRSGVEAGANDILSGSPGGRLAVVDCETRAERTVIGKRRPVEPQDVMLTIDKDFQVQVDKALGSVHGSAVILDPRTGAVLALASRPSYDPNWFVGGFAAKDLDFINNESERPLLNRATDASYPTGSIFKVITMAAGMEHLGLEGDSNVECPQEWSLPGTDQIWRDWTYETGSPAQGTITLHNALVNSCNTVFYQLGAELDKKNESYLPEMTKAFGLGAPTEIPYFSEVSGIVPDPEWKQTVIGDYWARGDAVHERLEVRVGREVDLVEVGPVHDREQVGVGRREALAGQIRPAREMPVEIGEAVGELRLCGLLGGLRRVGLPERAEALVDLRRDEGKPFLKAVALHRAVRRGKAGLRRLVREILHEGRDLGQHLAVVEAQRRDVTLGIHLGEALAALGLARGEVELVEVDLEPGLAGHD
jgi:cell division protein FtsI/penicillin-binding protein 2